MFVCIISVSGATNGVAAPPAKTVSAVTSSLVKGDSLVKVIEQLCDIHVADNAIIFCNSEEVTIVAKQAGRSFVALSLDGSSETRLKTKVNSLCLNVPIH